MALVTMSQIFMLLLTTTLFYGCIDTCEYSHMVPQLTFSTPLGGYGCPNMTMPCSVINSTHPVVEPSSKFGFEGGRVILVDGRYHLFTAEMYDNPWNVAMRLAHWSSHDAITWKREQTVFTSSIPPNPTYHECLNNSDSHAALWEPIAVNNGSTFLLFFTGYHCADASGRLCYNCNGTIFSAVSISGTIYGPYVERGAVLSRYSPGSLGLDSFHPYRAHDNRWRALVGFMLHGEASSVGIAEPVTQDDISGPWKLVQLDFGVHEYIENPVVVTLPEHRGFVALSDVANKSESDGFVFLYSEDGKTWSPTLHSASIHGGCRTPLGLVPILSENPMSVDNRTATPNVSYPYYVIYTYRPNHNPWYPYPPMTNPNRYEAVFVMKGSISFPAPISDG